MSQVPTAAIWERSLSSRGVMSMQDTSPFSFTCAFSSSLLSVMLRHTRLPSPVANTTCTQCEWLCTICNGEASVPAVEEQEVSF